MSQSRFEEKVPYKIARERERGRGGAEEGELGEPPYATGLPSSSLVAYYATKVESKPRLGHQLPSLGRVLASSVVVVVVVTIIVILVVVVIFIVIIIIL